MQKGPEHVEAVRQRVFEYVLEHGLADLSLRPLAKAVGLSPRVLLYHFGSKEQLVDQVLAAVRGRNLTLFQGGQTPRGESSSQAFRRLWGMLSRTESRPFLKLFFHVYGLALQEPGRYPAFSAGVVSDWLDALGGTVGDLPQSHATLALAAVRGLLLDLLTTGDVERTTAAAEVFSSALDGMTDQMRSKCVRT